MNIYNNGINVRVEASSTEQYIIPKLQSTIKMSSGKVCIYCFLPEITNLTFNYTDVTTPSAASDLALFNILAGYWASSGTVYADFETDIVAHAGGGQANATQLSSIFSTVTTVVTDDDSTKLPSAVVGMPQFQTRNDGAQTMAVYPPVGEYMNGTLNASESVAPGETAIFVVNGTGYWVKYSTY